MITRVSFFICLLCVALVNAKSNRIIGGYRPFPGQFKYQVSVQINNDHLCGGAIIDDRYVLTAAHCVVDPNGNFYQKNYQVFAGSTNLFSPGVQIDVEKIYVPMKLFNDRSYDIAVLKLRRGLDLDSNPNLQKINLPSSKEPSYIGETLVMSGYGFIYVEVRTNPITHLPEEVNGRRDGLLKYPLVKILSNSECTKQNPGRKIGRNQFCGQMVQRGGDPEGVCTGDSGGPLVSGNTIIGVSSHSPRGCNEVIYAGIYTRVSPFIGFIEKAMKDAKSTLIVVREIHSDESCSSSKGHGKSGR